MGRSRRRAGSARRPGTVRVRHDPSGGSPGARLASEQRPPCPAPCSPARCRLLRPPLSLLHRPRAPQHPRGGLRLLGAGGHPGTPRQAPLAPVPGTDGTLPGAPAAGCPGRGSRGCGSAGRAGATEPRPSRPSCRLQVPGGGGNPPTSPRFPPAALTGARRRPRRGAGAPRPPLHRAEGGTERGAGIRRGALCPGGGAPVPPDRARPPRPGATGPQGPALPGRCRAGAAAERHGGRRRRLRGGQGRRYLRSGPLRAAAAGAGADRQRGLRPDRVRLPGRGWLHEPAREQAALLRLQPQRGRLSLRHRHRSRGLPRLHLLLHGRHLFPPDQQHYRPQVPGPGRPVLLRSLDLPVVHRLLFLDQPVVLDTA